MRQRKIFVTRHKPLPRMDREEELSLIEAHIAAKGIQKFQYSETSFKIGEKDG